MNFCMDCYSYYSTPGTCNCFAAGGKRAPHVYMTGNTQTLVTCPACGKAPCDGSASGCPYPPAPYRITVYHAGEGGYPLYEFRQTITPPVTS
jgi:hypothetical protein